MSRQAVLKFIEGLFLKAVQAAMCLPLVLFLSGCAESREDLVLSLQSGETRALSEYSGKHLLINYWAIWCKPCVKEIPELNELDAHAEIAVLGYNFDRAQGEVLEKQLQQLSIQFPQVIEEPSSLFSQSSPSGLPATMLIAPDGRFVRWLMGPQTAEGILELTGVGH